MARDYRELQACPRHKLLDWFTECEHKVGLSTFEISVPSLPPGIVINDPQNVEHVFKNTDVFIKGDFFKLRSWDLFDSDPNWNRNDPEIVGNGIINADGDLWRIQRKAGLRFFSNSQLKSFIDDVLPSLLEDTMEILDSASLSNRTIDMQETFLSLTTRLMGNVAYDVSPYTRLTPVSQMDIPDSLPFSQAFGFASGAIGERFQNPFWKLKELLFGKRLRKAVMEVKQFGRGIVSGAVRRRKARDPLLEKPTNEGQGSAKCILIDSLLDHLEDHEVVADAAMNYLSAGRDTTAQALTWTLYLLLRNPQTVQKILSELQQRFVEGCGPTLSYSAVQPGSLPYITATFNESVRLYPPVPVELKECTMETVFPDGTSLPKGAVVIWVPWAMGRSQHIWGPDANDFRPERWLNTSSEQPITKSASEFPAFNGGARACIGKKLAELLAVYVIAALTWDYEFVEIHDEKLGGHTILKERLSQNSLTLPMAKGLPVKVKRRDKLPSSKRRG
ncbi:MAG: hypothetical protein Q9191_000949 [Dirinaria sp. TL-2023a]